MTRTLPPTSAPIPFRSLFHGMMASLLEDGAEAKFRGQIEEYFNAKYAFLASSGKAALSLSLNALQKVSQRPEVVIPAYSSFCLASAVARTGLSVKLCDIDPDTLDFDLAKLKAIVTEKTLAVIPVHNYGLVCYMKDIQQIASEKGAYVVEDAAQAAGASIASQKVGTIGDIGILSLGRGKNFCALGGGVILTNKEQFASPIADLLKKCPGASRISNMKSLAVGMALSFFLDPKRYAVPSKFPFLGIGANVFNPNFRICRLPKLNAEIGRKTFLLLEKYNEIRIRNARLFNDSLKTNPQARIPKANPEGRSVYLRFPVLFPTREIREQSYELLEQNHLGASRSYPTPLNQVTKFKKFLTEEDKYPGAQFVADRILTLPTHPFINEGDIERIVLVINQSFGKR